MNSKFGILGGGGVETTLFNCACSSWLPAVPAFGLHASLQDEEGAEGAQNKMRTRKNER